MKKDLQDKLFNKYPDLFKKLDYISCSDGWYNLLDRLCSCISNHLKHTSNEVEPVVVRQIKEKFSTLRYYYDGGDDTIHGMVRMAEAMSQHICEICGDAGTCGSPEGYGWLRTTCSKHTYYYRDRDVDKKKKGAIALDFDGVLNSYKSGFVAVADIPDPPVEGSFEAIKEYLDSGLKVYIYSTRNEWEEGRKAIKNWFLEHGLEQETVDKLEIVSGKPIAKLYIDDRAWHFSGKFPSVDEIRYYRPWHGGSSSSQK